MSSKKYLEPEVKEKLAYDIIKEYNVSISRACERLISIIQKKEDRKSSLGIRLRIVYRTL